MNLDGSHVVLNLDWHYRGDAPSARAAPEQVLLLALVMTADVAWKEVQRAGPGQEGGLLRAFSRNWIMVYPTHWGTEQCLSQSTG